MLPNSLCCIIYALFENFHLSEIEKSLSNSTFGEIEFDIKVIKLKYQVIDNRK